MPATPTETDVVEHERRVAARPETVFAFFTDPMKMVQWMGVEATLDPRPGGMFRMAFRPLDAMADFLGPTANGPDPMLQLLGPSRLNAVRGEFVEVEPHTRIVFTWGYERELFAMPPQATAVEVTLTPEGKDTVLRLVHRRLPTAATAFHRAGWNHYLPRLAIVAAGEDPGPDPWQAPPA
jgi:uncharacterized protein YndB with AHSA1/START domain